jgi:hypothetical protein
MDAMRWPSPQPGFQPAPPVEVPMGPCELPTPCPEVEPFPESAPPSEVPLEIPEPEERFGRSCSRP